MRVLAEEAALPMGCAEKVYFSELGKVLKTFIFWDLYKVTEL